MSIETLSGLVSRLFFGVAFLFLAVAVLERLVNSFGYTIVREAFRYGRFLDVAAVLLMFVIALLLRQIRDALAKPR